MKELNKDEMLQINGGGLTELGKTVVTWFANVCASHNKDPYNKEAWDMTHKM